MREAITSLAKDESHRLQTIIAAHQLDHPLSLRAQKYYRELRRLNQASQDVSLSMDSLMKTALAIAEQSQPLVNMQGTSLGTVCLLLNRLLGDKSENSQLIRGLGLYASGMKG